MHIKIHERSIVVDSHNDTMAKVVDDKTWLPKVDIGKETKFDIDISKLKAGGLDVPFFAAYTDGYYGNTAKSISRTLALINALYWTERNNSDVFKITSSTKDIYEAVKENKIGAVPTIEGAYSFDKENAIDLLHQYYDLGVVAVGFTWNYSNELGEGAKGIFGDEAGTPSPKGLTKLGEDVAKEMNRLGMLIDVSHMSEQSFWDVINVSKAPIMASHSGVYNLKNHNRNLTDEQLKALAKNGGVIGIVLYPAFLTDNNKAYIKDFVDHVDYVVDLIGIDHVALGSDFDGATMPEDLKDSSEFYKITDELVARGYSEEDIEKILGKNTLRVLSKVEELAEKDVNNADLGVFFKTEYNMGEIIKDDKPLLSAKIETKNSDEIEKLKFRVIVDGIPYSPKYEKKESKLSYQVMKALEEGFHIVSFEASNNKGEVYRKTRIFYIK